VDSARYAGTGYQPAGGVEVCGPAGFARCCDDSHVTHGAAKRLWLRAWSAHARARSANPLPPLPGEQARAFGALPGPLRCAESLAKTVRAVPDPRGAAGRQRPLPAMLTNAVLGLACTVRTICDLVHFG
jgi:hypothetical protein